MKHLPLIFGVFLIVACIGTAAIASLVNSFNAGELSPMMKYRVDIDKQHMGVESMENMLVKPQGATVRRAGTKYIGTATAATDRLVQFEYSTTSALVLRFEDGKVYFYKNGAAVQAP